MRDVIIEYPGLQYMYTALQVVFGNRLQARITQNRVKVKLYGEEIRPGAIPLVVQLVALALGLSLAVFVTSLIVETGWVCDEKLACFPFNYSLQLRPLIRQPIQNCSIYQNNDITIMCFHFTIRFIDALSSSGGILALTTIGLNFYVAFVLTLAKVKICRSKILRGCLVVLLIGSTILLSTLAWILPLALNHKETLKSFTNWESFLIYYYTIVYIIIIATVLPCCMPRYRRDLSKENLRYVGSNEELETPDQESHDESDSPPIRTRATRYYDQNGSQNHQTRYYGAVEVHQSPSERLNRPPPPVSKQSGDPEPQSSASETSITPAATGAKKVKEELSPLFNNTKSAQRRHSTKRRSSKKASGSLKRSKKRRERRGTGQGSHWADTKKDTGSEEELSTSENDYRQRGNANKTESSSEEEGGGYGPQGGEGGGERERGKEQESARIRAVLTEGVENRERTGDVSVRTHL